ncbi:hypothetical protein [Legionella waltersii]|nr:hypothetical protein [Legionella waltersii]
MKEKNDQMKKSNTPMQAVQNKPKVLETFPQFISSCPYLLAKLDYDLERAGTKVDYGNETCKQKKGIFVSEIIKKQMDAVMMVQRLNEVYQDPDKKLFTVVKSSSGQGFRIQVSFHRIDDYDKENKKIFNQVLMELKRSFSFKINDDVLNPQQITKVDWSSDQTFPAKMPIFFGVRGEFYGGRSKEFVKNTLVTSFIDTTNSISKLFNDNLKLVEEGHRADEYFLEPKVSVKIVRIFNSLPAQLKSRPGREAFKNEVGGQIIQGITGMDKDSSKYLAQNYLRPEDIGRLSQLNRGTREMATSFFKKQVASSKNEPESSNNSTLKKG